MSEDTIINDLRKRSSLIENFDDARLMSHAAELLERSAGVWVPVGERLPAGYCPVMNKGRIVFEAFCRDGLWINMRPTSENGDMTLRNVTHWLDVRLPGEQHD